VDFLFQKINLRRGRRYFRVKRLKVIKVAGRVLSIVALAALATPVHGEDDFPLVGTYTENRAARRMVRTPAFHA
jgi:hypothetical protein